MKWESKVLHRSAGQRVNQCLDNEHARLWLTLEALLTGDAFFISKIKIKCSKIPFLYKTFADPTVDKNYVLSLQFQDKNSKIYLLETVRVGSHSTNQDTYDIQYSLFVQKANVNQKRQAAFIQSMKNTEFAKILLILKKTPQLRVSLQVAWNTKRYQEDLNKKKSLLKPTWIQNIPPHWAPLVEVTMCSVCGVLLVLVIAILLSSHIACVVVGLSLTLNHSSWGTALNLSVWSSELFRIVFPFPPIPNIVFVVVSCPRIA